MIKPSVILKETNITKVKGDLASFDAYGKLKGKCALGVISCENYMVLTPETKEDASYTKIMLASLPKSKQWLEKDQALPYFDYFLRKEDDDGYSSLENGGWLLSRIIYQLNDSSQANLSFKELGEFLEVTFGV